MNNELDAYFNHWFLQSAAMALTIGILPKIRITGVSGPILMVFMISLFNTFVWDAGLFFKLPQDLTSQTITILIANGFIFWLLVKLLPGIEISGILPALIAPILFTVINVVLNDYKDQIDIFNFFSNFVHFFKHLKAGFS